MSDNLQDLVLMSDVVERFRRIGTVGRTYLLTRLNEEHLAIGDKADDIYAEIRRQYVHGGGRMQSNGIIPYIKRVREIGLLSLKEAKDLVESWG